MSRTQFVEYRDHGFWAYDVALGVFLKRLIDAAEEYHATEAGSWLSEAISWWRVVACVSDYGLTLDSTWSAEQVATIPVQIVVPERAERVCR